LGVTKEASLWQTLFNQNDVVQQGGLVMMVAQEAVAFKGEALAREFQALLESVRRHAEQGTAIHEVERGLFASLLNLGRQLLTEFVRLQGPGDCGATLTLPSGRTLKRLAGPRPRPYRSIFGDLELCRVVYGAREGQKVELAPLDTRLQLPASAYSYVLQDWAQAFGMEQAWPLVHDLLAKVLGIKVPVDSLERMNRHMAGPVEAFRAAVAPPPPADEGAVFVVGGDGKGIPMRRTAAENAAKPGPHRHKGEKANKKRMAIVGTIDSVDRYPRTPEQLVAALFEDGPEPAGERPTPCHKHLWACLTYEDGPVRHDGLTDVFVWLADELGQRNPGPAQPTVCLMDGQESLWQARRNYLPADCVDVLDLMHVLPRLWDVAHVFHPEGSAAAAGFVRERLLRVLRGESLHVRTGLRQMATKHDLTGARRRTVDRVCDYLEANEGRMRYDAYLAAGLPIASGVLEGACRHYVKDRMERSGMRWTMTGAQAMLDLRSRWLNGDWEQYQTFRINTETARLHPHRQLVAQMHWSLAA
jgi:hypothetical protein